MAKVKNAGFIDGLCGSAGNAVFVSSPYGTLLRDRPRQNNPRTPAQQAVRRRMALAGAAWRTMGVDQAEAWRAYAVDQTGRAANAQNLFAKLATRYLQVNPQGQIPLMPPARLFPGDGVTFEIAASTGVVEVRSDQANTPGVVTEVLFQPVLSVHRRTYLTRYRSQGFRAFTAAQTWTVPSQQRGVIAVAVRFVQSSTGQATELMEIGRVVVP